MDQVARPGPAQLAVVQRMPGVDHVLPQLPLFLVAIYPHQFNLAKFTQAAPELVRAGYGARCRLLAGSLQAMSLALGS